MRARFVLRYRGEGPKPEADVERVRALADTVVVDDSSSRMLLVESRHDLLDDLVGSLPDWIMAPEQTYQVPDTREQVERPPQ
ncbi:MAG: hypothetical protein V7605_1141 [Acidimicrobiaceae bacterium]